MAKPSYVTSRADSRGQQFHWWKDPRICIGLPVLGQSHAEGINPTEDALLSPEPLYDHALMPSGGPRVRNRDWDGFAPLSETLAVDGRRESPCSGMVNHLIALVRTRVSPDLEPKVFTFAAARPATAIRRLGRGSTEHNRFTDSIRRFVANCRAKGWTPHVPAFVWVQGEADADDAGYAMALRTVARNLADDTRLLTGQAELPICVYSQVNSGVNADPTRPGWEPHFAGIAQGRLHGEHLLRCSGPLYPFPVSLPAEGGDGMHLSSLGQLRHGRQIARTLFAELAGVGAETVVIDERSSRWVSDRVLRLGTTATTDLQLCSADVAPTTRSVHGLQVLLRDGALLGRPDQFTVSLPVNAGGGVARHVELVFAEPPGQSLSVYGGLRKDGPGSGPLTGGRTSICDSAGDRALDRETADGDHVQNNYLAAFMLEGLPAP